MRAVQRSLLRTLISSFVVSKLDSCSVAVAGLPSCDLDRLQSVINAAARLTVGHITLLLADLHWLRIPQRIRYRLCVLVYQCVQGWTPERTERPELPAEHHLPGRECGITASPALRVIGRSHRAGDATYNNGRRTAPSPSQHGAPRTVCPTRSVAAHRWLS